MSSDRAEGEEGVGRGGKLTVDIRAPETVRVILVVEVEE